MAASSQLYGTRGPVRAPTVAAFDALCLDPSASRLTHRISLACATPPALSALPPCSTRRALTMSRALASWTMMSRVRPSGPATMMAPLWWLPHRMA